MVPATKWQIECHHMSHVSWYLIEDIRQLGRTVVKQDRYVEGSYDSGYGDSMERKRTI